MKWWKLLACSVGHYKSMFIDEQEVVIRNDNRCDPRGYTKSIQTSMIIYSMRKNNSIHVFKIVLFQ